MPDTKPRHASRAAVTNLDKLRSNARKLGDLRPLSATGQQSEPSTPSKEELLELNCTLSEKVLLLEAELEIAKRCAHYDELTGLPNRQLFRDRFIQASSLATRNRHLLGLVFFDLDDFKGVNDRLGHEAGDKLLQQVAARLTTAIRKSDTACRYGGDEFVVLLTEIDKPERALKKLSDIRAYLAEPYTVGRHSIRMSASIGIAIYPNDSEDFHELLRTSDHSMYRNKYASRDQSGGLPRLQLSTL